MGLCGAEAAGEPAQRAADIWTLPLSSAREVLSLAGRFATDGLIMAKEKKKGKLRAELFGCFDSSRHSWLSLTHIFALLGIAAGTWQNHGKHSAGIHRGWKMRAMVFNAQLQVWGKST